MTIVYKELIGFKKIRAIKLEVKASINDNILCKLVNVLQKHQILVKIAMNLANISIRKKHTQLLAKIKIIINKILNIIKTILKISKMNITNKKKNQGCLIQN